MSMIKATDQTYNQLIAQPGLTLVMFDDTRHTYGNCVKLRAAFRALARSHSGKLSVVLADERHLTIHLGQLPFLPTFRMYRDGERVGQWYTNSHRSDRGMTCWAEGFLPEEDRTEFDRFIYDLPHGL
jgi:hypothetical protein